MRTSRTTPDAGLRRLRTARSAGIALAAVLGVAALAGCGADTTPDTIGVVRETKLNVADVRLTDVTDTGTIGEGIVEDGDLLMKSRTGRLLLVYFGFTNCPDVCPTTFADLRLAMRDLDPAQRERVDVAFATVDPDRDTPENMNAYMTHFFDSYHVLRGTDSEIRQATDAFLASYEIGTDDKGRVSVSHTAVLYAVDDQGDVVIEWPFGTTGESIAKDLRTLLQEQGDA